MGWLIGIHGSVFYFLDLVSVRKMQTIFVDHFWDRIIRYFISRPCWKLLSNIYVDVCKSTVLAAVA